MDDYVSGSKVAAGLAGIVTLLAGWLFAVIVGSLGDMKDQQEELMERVSVVEVRIDNLDDSMETLKNVLIEKAVRSG